jgi:hypothetical protein
MRVAALPWRTQLNRQSVSVTERRLRCEKSCSKSLRQFDLASCTHRRDLYRLTLVRRQKAADGNAN